MESDDCVIENVSMGTDTAGKSCGNLGHQRSSPVTPSLSASAKKLIQARLPFKPLHVEQCAGDGVVACKKRKLIDSNSNFQEAKSLKKHDTAIDKIDDISNDCIILDNMPSSPISDPIIESKTTEHSVVLENNPIIPLPTSQSVVGSVVEPCIENKKTSVEVTLSVPSSTSLDPSIQLQNNSLVETRVTHPLPPSTNSEPVVESENNNVVVLMEDKPTLGVPSSPNCITAVKAKNETVKLNSVEKEAREKLRAMEKEKREKEKKEKEEAKLKKIQERQEKEKEREREKAEKEREREREKAEKEKEKAEKEKEKAERKKQKEDERLRKQEQLLEEKKKKEEAKLEEKKKKEEKKPEEKVGVKEKELMQKFFVKSMKDLAVAKASSDAKSGPFMQFQVKENMKLAPIVRLDPESRLQAAVNLDSVFIDETSVFDRSQLYISRLHDINYRRKTSPSTWPSCRRHVNEDVVVVKPDGETAGCFMRAKLFQFHDNYRPAYYGTWRKKSREIRPRNPWSLDKKQLDYEVDSDEEWEEEEPGESLSHSEHDDDDDDEPEPDEDSDGFFVPHGYLSDGEGCADDDDGDDDAEKSSPEKLKARQLAKARNWENEIRCKKSEVLHPIVIDICWWAPDATAADPLYNKLREFQVLTFQETPISTASKSKVLVKFKKAEKLDSKNITWIPFPDSALVDLVRLVHGNECGIKKLTREFCEFWRQTNQPQSEGLDVPEKQCHLSKRRLEEKIRQISVYESRPEYPRRRLWYINKETLDKLQMSSLPVPTEWKWLTKAVIPSS